MLEGLRSGPNPPDEVFVVVEIPKGSRNKYEYNKKGYFFLDRVLHSSLTYNGDYGIIPRTLCPDGDPLDVIVLVDQPSFPGCVMHVRPIGLVKMSDEKGEDDKIVAVLKDDPMYNEVNDIGDLPKHVSRELEYFFKEYKSLETGKTVSVGGVFGAEEAKKVILESIRLYRKKL